MQRIPGLLMRYTSVLLVVLLSACATLAPPEEEQAPVPVSANVAVVALVDTARTDAGSGKLDVAGATLERALRIEPRNPMLWHELAQLRLQQGQFAQAESLAAKSNAWAGGDKRLRAANWRIIGEVRAQRGDWEGAQAAFDRAEEEAK